MTLRCPTCDADVQIVVDDRCVECGDAEIVAIVESGERLQHERFVTELI